MNALLGIGVMLATAASLTIGPWRYDARYRRHLEADCHCTCRFLDVEEGHPIRPFLKPGETLHFPRWFGGQVVCVPADEPDPLGRLEDLRHQVNLATSVAP